MLTAKAVMMQELLEVHQQGTGNELEEELLFLFSKMLVVCETLGMKSIEG